METKSTTGAIDAKRDRIEDARISLAHEEMQFILNNPAAGNDTAAVLEFRAKKLTHIMAKYSDKLSPRKKRTWLFVSDELTTLVARQKPGRWSKLVSGERFRNLKHFVFGDFQGYQGYNRKLQELSDEAIARHNEAQVVHHLKEKGFTRDILDKIREHLTGREPEFRLRYYDPAIPDTDFLLHFKKQPETKFFQFTSFDAFNRPELEQKMVDTQQLIRHTFPVEPRPGYEMICNAVEAANLVNKRAISKDGSNWLYLDLHHLNDSFPFKGNFFDILKAIEDLPFKMHLKKKDIADLVLELKKGNIPEIKLPLGDEKRTVKLKADPYNNELFVTDTKGVPIDKNELSELGAEEI